MLFHNAINATNIPYVGRMAPATAGLFTLLGMALLLLDFETPGGWWPSGYMGLVTVIGGIIALLGYLYSVKAISEFHVGTPRWRCIPRSSLSLLGLRDGLLAARREVRWKRWSADYAGGVMARILLPMAIVMPYVNGWLRQAGERAGLYSSGVGMASFSAGYIVLFSSVIWMIARNTNRIDEERRATQEHDAKLAAIVDYSGDAIIGVTLEGVITSWNKGATDMYGYTADEAIGKTGAALLVPGGREEEPGKLISEIGQGRAVLGYETMRRRKDGTLVRVSLTISPVADKQGMITGGAIIARDITASKRIEADLRASEDRLTGTRAHPRPGAGAGAGRGWTHRTLESRRGVAVRIHAARGDGPRLARLAMHRVSRAARRNRTEAARFRRVGRRTDSLPQRRHASGGVQQVGALHASAGKSPRILEANTDITALKRAEDSLIQAQKMQAIRDARRRHCARFQQHPVGHQRARRLCRRGSSERPSSAKRYRRDHPRQRPRDESGEADPHLQPPRRH